MNLETRNCDISENLSSGEDVDGNDGRNNSSNKFQGETQVKSANRHVYTAKSGKKWKSVPPPSSHTGGANIFTKKVGPKVRPYSRVQFLLQEILRFNTTKQKYLLHTRPGWERRGIALARRARIHLTENTREVFKLYIVCFPTYS